MKLLVKWEKKKEEWEEQEGLGPLQPPGLETKWEQQQAGRPGRALWSREGQSRPPHGTSAQQSHGTRVPVTFAVSVHTPLCVWLWGKHHRLSDPTRPHTTCVPGPLTVLIPWMRGSERCRSLPKVTQLVRGRLRIQAQDCGTPEPQLLTRMSHSPSQTVSWKSLRDQPHCSTEVPGACFSFCTYSEGVGLTSWFLSLIYIRISWGLFSSYEVLAFPQYLDFLKLHPIRTF